MKYGREVNLEISKICRVSHHIVFQKVEMGALAYFIDGVWPANRDIKPGNVLLEIAIRVVAVKSINGISIGCLAFNN